MGLGARRQYRGLVGGQSDGTFGPLSIGSQLAGLFNDGFLGEYGSSQANMWVYRGALRIPAVWRATLLIADLLAQVDWDAYTKHGRDVEEMLDPRPVLLEQPSPPDTRFTTLRSGMIDYIHDGNAIGVIATRDSYGTPTSYWPVPASWVGVRRINADNAGTSMLPVGAIEYQVGSRTFPSDQVIHIKGPCAPGALRGAGVLEMFLTGTFETAHEQEREAKKNSRHGVPTGILKYKNDTPPGRQVDKDGNTRSIKDRMREAADQWLAARDHNGVAVMNNAVDFQALSWNPDQMQMVQARQFTLLQIANIMGIPPKFVGAATGDSLTYNTSETGGKELLRDTMGGYFTQWSQTLSLKFPRGTNVKPNLDDFLKTDLLQRYQAYQTGIDAGFLRPNKDVRRMENLPDDPKLDEAPTASAAKQLNKGLSITDEGLKQVVVGDLGGNIGTSKPDQPNQPVQAAAQRLPVPAIEQQPPAPHQNQQGGQ